MHAHLLLPQLTTGLVCVLSAPPPPPPPLSPQQVEAALGVEGDDILYVGDHIYTDAALAKINFRCVGGWVVGSVVCVWVGGG